MRRRHSYDHSASTDAARASYRIVPRTAPLDARELDCLEDALEVVIAWGGEAVLQVAHLSPPRTFTVGEDADFLIGEASLGRRQLPLAWLNAGQLNVVIPDGATGALISPDGELQSFDELASQCRLERHEKIADARHTRLVRGASAHMQHAGFTFIVRNVAAARRVAASNGLDFSWEHSGWTAASLAAHLAVLVLFWLTPPCLIVPHVAAASRLSIVPPRSAQAVVAADDGRRERGPQGQLGKPSALRTPRHYAVAGPRDNPDPHLARSEQTQRAATGGIVGILLAAGSANTPSSRFGRDQALGRDSSSAIGALMGDRAGGNFGFGGLLLRGRGRGGGGNGEGTIGLGNIGTIGVGGCCGSGSGYGTGPRDMHGRSARLPRVRGQVQDLSEGLSKEVVRRTIGRHLAEVRQCYEQELTARPDLSGRVAVKFVIAPNGAVQTAVVAQSDLDEHKVEQCILQAVKRWSFPPPENGSVVAVEFPFDLSTAGK